MIKLATDARQNQVILPGIWLGILFDDFNFNDAVYFRRRRAASAAAPARMAIVVGSGTASAVTERSSIVRK